MPVYNTGEILRNTIDSVLNQSFKDFELLLIDDGSKDISSKICDEMSLKDSRIRTFHKINGGICDARNYGLNHAKGDYITFCDHDDEYKKEYLELLVKNADLYNADLVHCNNFTKHDNGKVIQSKTPNFILEGNQILNSFIHLCKISYFDTVWCTLYTKQLIGNTRFDTNFKHGGEDFDFNMRLMEKINKIVSISQPLYIHYFRKSLSTSAKFKIEDIDISYKSFLSLSKVVKKHNLSIDNPDQYYSLFYSHLLSIIGAASRTTIPYSGLKPIIKKIKNTANNTIIEPTYIPRLSFQRQKIYIFYLFTKLHLTHLFFLCKCCISCLRRH